MLCFLWGNCELLQKGLTIRCATDARYYFFDKPHLADKAHPPTMQPALMRML